MWEPSARLGPCTFGQSAYVSRSVAATPSDRVTIRFDGSAQISGDSLLATEEFALGGSRIGRAFDFNEVTGDRGFGGMVELSYRLGDTGHGLKSLELFTFADGGGAFRKRSLPVLPDEQWLASLGVGTRITALGLLWSGEIGFPVVRKNVDRGVRAFLSVTKYF